MSRQKDKKLVVDNEQTAAFQRRVEILTGVLLLAFGVYQSILYFGHTAVPNGDFPDLFKVGSDLLSFKPPARFKQAPVLGLLQNFLYPLAWGTSRKLTAGWLLNAILHPLNLLLLWLVGKKIIGRAATWIAVILIINPWTIYLLTEPIIETTYLFFILLSFYLIFSRSRWAYLAAATASMVRYEGAALILAAFLADFISNKSRARRIRAFVYALLSSLPLAIWLLGTVLSWRSEQGQGHYLTILFSKEYWKAFAEPIRERTGILLNMGVLWRTGFAPLLTPYPGAGEDAVNMIFKFSSAAVLIGFLLGCVFSVIRRQWQVWLLLLFFVPYFILHAFYPYPLGRFHSTIVWIAMFLCCFGWQCLWRSASGRWVLPKAPAASFLHPTASLCEAKRGGVRSKTAGVLQFVLIVIAVLWLAGLAPYIPKVSSFSPRSASIPYAAAALVALILAGQVLFEKTRTVLSGLTILAVMSLMIASNQLGPFGLARLLGNGQKEIEFKQLGEWFAQNAKPGEKIAVYNCGPAQLFAGKYADNIVGFPKADSPQHLVEKLREEKVTYVTWATREGFSKQHTGYQLLELDRNIAFLNEPRSIGQYEFIGQVGSQRGFINIFRLIDQGEKQLPAQ